MLYPQTQTVLKHMQRRGSISPMEALISYGITRLAARIYDLRSAGYDIHTDLRMDESGKGYARYSLQKVAN